MAKHPIQSVEAPNSARHHERGPTDLTRDTPPPDPATGLTPADTMAALEDPTRSERMAPTDIPGVYNHPRRGGFDKCGAKQGRCFGEIIRGKCVQCGQDYTKTTPLGGVNGRF